MSRLTPHASQRAEERYDRPFTGRDAKAIVKIIRGGGAQVIRQKRLTETRSRVVVDYDGRLWDVVFSRRRGKIMTCLPIDDERATAPRPEG